MTYEAVQQATAAAMADPQPGDHLHELYSFHVFVVEVTDGGILAIMEGSPPITFPHGADASWLTREQFQRRFAYGSIPGSWVMLSERGVDVKGWLEHAKVVHPLTEEP